MPSTVKSAGKKEGAAGSPAKHTPAPWRVGQTVSGKRWIYGPDDIRVGKAASDRRGPERAANERLMTAAPELFAAARSLIAFVAEGDCDLYDGAEGTDVRRDLEAAIAKAEGK